MAKKHIVLLVPLIAFFLLTGFLLKGLFSEPRYENTSTLNKPLPPFELPQLMAPENVITHKDLIGEVTLLNVWGTWCVTCAIELPYLTKLRANGVKIVGLYFEQDIDPDFGVKPLPQIQVDVTQTLQRLGNPYQYNIFDQYRDYSFDLGVTGAPETLLIDKNGVVLLHHVGDINPRVWEEKFKAVYEGAIRG